MTSEFSTSAKTVSRHRVDASGIHKELDHVIEERAVAFVYNGISHAVMMATPFDLEDFAIGLSYTEGIVSSLDEILEIDLGTREQGIELEISISARSFANLKARRRSFAGKSGCGLCGVESLREAVPEIPQITTQAGIDTAALRRAKRDLNAHQVIRSVTGSAHAAALCSCEGEIILVREDVGRHNALDKLIGAMLRANESLEGFILMTSRASYELVSKTAVMGVPILACVSAPTSVAIEEAERAGLTLICYLSREEEMIYSGKERILDSLKSGVS